MHVFASHFKMREKILTYLFKSRLPVELKHKKELTNVEPVQLFSMAQVHKPKCISQGQQNYSNMHMRRSKVTTLFGTGCKIVLYRSRQTVSYSLNYSKNKIKKSFKIQVTFKYTVNKTINLVKSLNKLNMEILVRSMYVSSFIDFTEALNAEKKERLIISKKYMDRINFHCKKIRKHYSFRQYLKKNTQE